MDYSESYRPHKRRRGMGRRKFLKLGGFGAGALALAGAGVVSGEKILRGLEKVSEIISYDAPPGKRFEGMEVDGRKREFVFVETPDGEWPILRKEPNLSKELGRVKPETKAQGAEVYGATYPSNLEAGDFVADPEDSRVHYGKWVRVDTPLPIYNSNGSPKLDKEGKQVMSMGFVSENFVKFEDNKAENP